MGPGHTGWEGRGGEDFHPDAGELFRCCRDVEIWAGGRVVRASLTGVTWAEESSVVECISMEGEERR